MSKLIINNGGKTGALLSTSTGIRRLPVFDAYTLKLLSAVNLVAHTNNSGDAKFDSGVSKISNKLSNQLITRLENMVGPLDEDEAVVYDSEDGGFVCGSTGKPPFPLPPLPDPIPDPLAFYDADMIKAFDLAIEKNFDLFELMEKPMSAAKKLNMNISERTAEELLQFAPSNMKQIKDPVAREILSFMHAIIKDKTYLKTWPQQPRLVADKLGFQLSGPALDRLLGVGPVASAGGAAVVVGVAILAGLVIVCAMECDRVIFNVRDRSERLLF